jgi:hypothetical protein
MLPGQKSGGASGLQVALSATIPNEKKRGSEEGPCPIARTSYSAVEDWPPHQSTHDILHTSYVRMITNCRQLAALGDCQHSTSSLIATSQSEYEHVALTNLFLHTAGTGCLGNIPEDFRAVLEGQALRNVGDGAEGGVLTCRRLFASELLSRPSSLRC